MLKKTGLFFAVSLFPSLLLATPEYDACYKKAQNDDETALCMKAETARVTKDLQALYLRVSQHPQTASWNNGNGLTSGNLKDMYNHFMAYRNRYCSLFTKASEFMFGSSDFDKERCLLGLTKEHYELMQTILINASGGGEEDDEYDDEDLN